MVFFKCRKNVLIQTYTAYLDLGAFLLVFCSEFWQMEQGKLTCVSHGMIDPLDNNNTATPRERYEHYCCHCYFIVKEADTLNS